MTSYHCSYFGTEQGRYPVEEFIDAIDEVAQRKFVYKRSMLESLGPRLMEPHAKSLGGGIFELRVSGRDSDFRVFYFFDGRRVIFTNAFKKKTGRTPKQELALALSRMGIFLASPDKYSL